MKKALKAAKFALCSTALLSLAVACGGGGGGGGGSSVSAKFTDEQVTDKIGILTDDFTGCSDTFKAPVASAKSLASFHKALYSVVSPMVFRRMTDVGTFNGDCGGSYTVTYGTHSNGNTTFPVTFNDYCSGTGGGERNIVDGAAVYEWDGDSTDSGNIIRAEKIDTTGSGVNVLVYNADGTLVKDSTVVVDGYKRTRGTPNTKAGATTWYPVTPTSGDPDKEYISKVKVTDNLTDDVSTATGLTASIYDVNRTDITDTSYNHTVTITGGKVSTPEGSFTLKTESGKPLVITNRTNFTGGTLILTGSKSSIKIEAATSGNNDFTVSVKGSDTAGEYVPHDLSCGDYTVRDLFTAAGN